MKTVLIIVAFLFLLIGASLSFVFYRLNQVVRESKQISLGPFVIHADAATSKNFNMNYGMVDSTNVAYSIWYNGEPIRLPGKLESNTGLPFVWKIFYVQGTTEPTLVAGSQSLFMIKIRNEQAVVIPLVNQFSDFATVQLLDSEEGQPGKEHIVAMTSDAERMDQIDVLEGGRLLLVCRLSVVDLETGELWEFSQQGRSHSNYSFPSTEGALVLSPDQQYVVFSGDYQTWNSQQEDYQPHAMVVFDFRADKGYVVPYDDNEMRLREVSDINRSWFDQRFEWVDSEHNTKLLQVRKRDLPLPWLGTYKPRDGYYILYPVQPTMLDVFLNFVLEYQGWTREAIIADETKIYAGRTIVLEKDGIKLDVNYREDEKQISLSKHLYLEISSSDVSYQELVKSIGDDYNKHLTRGEFQQYFSEVVKPDY